MAALNGVMNLRIRRNKAALGATAAFREKVLGSVEAGKLADLTILDRDILALPPRNIPDARVLFTIVAGRVVYETQR